MLGIKYRIVGLALLPSIVVYFIYVAQLFLQGMLASYLFKEEPTKPGA
jgi:positive regulator of sigma E activity